MKSDVDFFVSVKEDLDELDRIKSHLLLITERYNKTVPIEEILKIV